MSFQSHTLFLVEPINIGRFIILSPPNDHVLGMLAGWIFYWLWFGVALSLVSSIALSRVVKWRVPQLVGWSAAMVFASLVSALVAGISLFFLGYNNDFIGIFSLSGALFGFIFGIMRWDILRRYGLKTGTAVVISVCGWALGWSMWYLPDSLNIEIVFAIGSGIVLVTEVIALYWLYRKRKESLESK